MKRCKYCKDLLNNNEEGNICEFCAERKKAISEIKERRSICVDLKSFEYFAEDYDYAEVTEWTNGEGIDILLSIKNKETRLECTFAEFEAIANAVNKLSKVIIYKD